MIKPINGVLVALLFATTPAMLCTLPSQSEAGPEAAEPCGTLFPVSDYLMVRDGTVIPPEKLSGSNPDYSHLTQPLALSPVVLEVFVSAAGLVDGVLIIKGSDSPLSRPAVKAVFDSTFKPGSRAG